jgi:hypothetical protein
MTQAIGRGVFNRRAALAWIREHGDVDAVVYFADDDNAYDTRIFEEVRATVRISVFPVGLVQEFGISSPILRVRNLTKIEWTGTKVEWVYFEINADWASVVRFWFWIDIQNCEKTPIKMVF